MESIIKNDFVFYSKLARPMVLNLPESRDRTLAVAWIKKLSEESAGDETLRTAYLKLLLFCLQRRRLSGIFADDPLLHDVLEDLASNTDLNEFARNLLKQERQDRREVIRQETREDIAAFPPFTTDCSPDLTEYVAVQNIPNFGVHAYYAISKQPVNKWHRSELAIFPKGTKSAVDTSTDITTALGTPKTSASAPAVEEGAGASVPAELPSQGKKKRRPRKLGSSPPTRPIGQVKEVPEERLTPTWGTNLVNIRGRTDIGRIKKIDEALEEAVSQIIEDDEAEGERQERAANRRAEHESLAQKAKEMTYFIPEFKHGLMDGAKIQPPSRFANLGDRSSLQDPKSPKGPRIKAKSTKKKRKSSKDLGPRPANLPEEFDGSINEVLKENGLTWQDLMSQNIDEELKRIEDEVGMVEDNDEEFQVEDLELDGYEEIDYDGFCREAEAQLAANGTIYDKGVEEDEKLVGWLQDQIEEVKERQNIFRKMEEMRRVAPAISSGIPITTPQSLACPRRVKSPEEISTEATDHLLVQRQSSSYPFKNPKRQIPIDRKPKRSKEPTSRVRGLSKVIEKTQKTAKEASRQCSTRDDSYEFARTEREFLQGLGENRRSRSPRPSPGSYGMCTPYRRKAEDTGEVGLRTNEEATGNQHGVETLNAVRRNLFGSRREAMEVPEATDAKGRDAHGLKNWEQEPELIQELQQHQIDFLGITENCTIPQQEEQGIYDQDFSQVLHKTPQLYIEETPSPSGREAHSSSHPCMSCGSPEELSKFRRSQREIEQLIQLLSGLEAQIEETRRAAWGDIEAIVMELYPTTTDEGNEAESVDRELGGPLPPGNVHSTGISSGGPHSPGCLVPWELCEVESNHEYLAQGMQTGQGTMLGSTKNEPEVEMQAITMGRNNRKLPDTCKYRFHLEDDPDMYEYLRGYQLPESSRSQATKACETTHRQVDEIMFHIEDDQSVGMLSSQ